MRIYFDAGDEMIVRDVRAVDRLIKEGKLHEGQHVTRRDLARLLECEHEGGERPCAACAGEN